MHGENRKNDNARSCVRSLWEEGFFKNANPLGAVSNRITEKWGHNLPAADISNILSAAPFLIRVGKRRSYQYKQKTSPKSKKIETIEEQLFSTDLISKFGSRFETEIKDLHLNFGRSGTCTAFLLRKILEKLIFLVFAKNGISGKLEGKKTGRLVGLDAMVDSASQEKIDGIHILTPKTGGKIKLQI